MFKIVSSMTDKPNFGEIKAGELSVGDIVSWSKWDPQTNVWIEHLGVLLDVRSEVRGSRLVSISRVKPLNDPLAELKFFTLTLKLVSRSQKSRSSTT